MNHFYKTRKCFQNLNLEESQKLFYCYGFVNSICNTTYKHFIPLRTIPFFPCLMPLIYSLKHKTLLKLRGKKKMSQSMVLWHAESLELKGPGEASEMLFLTSSFICSPKSQKPCKLELSFPKKLHSFPTRQSKIIMIFRPSIQELPIKKFSDLTLPIACPKPRIAEGV